MNRTENTETANARKVRLRTAAAQTLAAAGWSVRDIHTALNSAPSSLGTVHRDIHKGAS